MKPGVILFTLAMLLLVLTQAGQAQIFDTTTQLRYDTNYIKVYKDELTTRIFLGRNQNGYTLSEKLFDPGLKYRTNDKLKIGMGYTYSFLNINLAVNMPFVNDDDDIYGESKYTDLSFQFSFREFICDLWFQWNRGFYLANPEDYHPVPSDDYTYPIRGDMRTSLIGANITYLFNSERYSYKASFLQNEFQKRSAGTPIVGIEGYWNLALADSSISTYSFPGAVVNFVDDEGFNQADLINVGFNGGYAYTFVWDERLYVSLASTIGISGAYHIIHNTELSYTSYEGMAVGLTNNSKVSIGFNSNEYYVGISFVRFSMSQLIGSTGDWINYSSGSIRFNVVKRFNLKRTIKILRPDLWIF